MRMSPQTPGLKTPAYCEVHGDLPSSDRPSQHCVNLFGKGLNVLVVNSYVEVPHNSFKLWSTHTVWTSGLVCLTKTFTMISFHKNSVCGESWWGFLYSLLYFSLRQVGHNTCTAVAKTGDDNALCVALALKFIVVSLPWPPADMAVTRSAVHRELEIPNWDKAVTRIHKNSQIL